MRGATVVVRAAWPHQHGAACVVSGSSRSGMTAQPHTSACLRANGCAHASRLQRRCGGRHGAHWGGYAGRARGSGGLQGKGVRQGRGTELVGQSVFLFLLRPSSSSCSPCRAACRGFILRGAAQLVHGSCLTQDVLTSSELTPQLQAARIFAGDTAGTSTARQVGVEQAPPGRAQRQKLDFFLNPDTLRCPAALHTTQSCKRPAAGRHTTASSSETSRREDRKDQLYSLGSSLACRQPDAHAWRHLGGRARLSMPRHRRAAGGEL